MPDREPRDVIDHEANKVLEAALRELETDRPEWSDMLPDRRRWKRVRIIIARLTEAGYRIVKGD